MTLTRRAAPAAAALCAAALAGCGHSAPPTNTGGVPLAGASASASTSAGPAASRSAAAARAAAAAVATASAAPAAGSTPSAGAPGDAGTAARGGSSTSQTAQAGPADGAYALARTGNDTVSGCGSGSRPDNGTTSLTVSTPSAGQRREVSDARDSSGKGAVTTITEAFGASSVDLVSYVFQDYYGSGTLTYTFNAPAGTQVLSPAPQQGQHWAFALTSTDGKAHLNGTVSVGATGTSERLGDGTTVQTAAVTLKATLTTTIAGTKVTDTVTQNAATIPGSLLPAHIDATSDAAFGCYRLHSTETDILRSRTPA